ncbi:helix-turn-helix transcriptional regulator [Streptomyces sp. NPDC059611]|uniref:helix-turn-helix transcriptional regulator n=1 Tax=Streptomyces sp. NPDC059611 TaxID=3346884 RepID=UPI0036A35D6F
MTPAGGSMLIHVPAVPSPRAGTASGPAAPDRTLGTFLRACRSRLSPAEAGVPVDSPRSGRQVKGLRREEVSVLTGISVSYYSRLEQGRAQNPSAPVVEALARGLGLGTQERGNLHRLAGLNPSLGPPHAQAGVHPSLRQALGGASSAVTLVLGPCLDVLAANVPAQAVLSPLGTDVNLLRTLFTHPPKHVFFTDRHSTARILLRALRANCARRPQDSHLSDLVQELSALSSDFAAQWALPEGRADSGGACTLAVAHPWAGPLTLTYRTLHVEATTGQRLITGSPASGSRDSQALTYLTAMSPSL